MIASAIDMKLVLSVDLRIVVCMIVNSRGIIGIENRYLYIIKILEMRFVGSFFRQSIRYRSVRMSLMYILVRRMHGTQFSHTAM